MNVEMEIQRLLGRSWSSYAELRGAVERVAGQAGYFDCFEEWQPGVVVIRKQPVGRESAGFSFQVTLQAVAIAA